MGADVSERMKPVMILPKDAVTRADIRELRRNGICVVEATDPSLVRFVDPPPQGYSAQERAAIQLARAILRPINRGKMISNDTWTGLFVDLILAGSPLESPPAPPAAKK